MMNVTWAHTTVIVTHNVKIQMKDSHVPVTQATLAMELHAQVVILDYSIIFSLQNS